MDKIKMVRLRANIIMALIVVALLWIISVICTGCSKYTPQVAQKEVGRALSTYRYILAELCRDNFPVTARTDSSAYLASRRAIDSLAAVISKDSLYSQEERERLTDEIERIRKSIPEPENCDSLSDAIYRYAAKETARADKLEKANRDLIAAAWSVKPIRDTVIDRAALNACELSQASAIRQLEAMTGEKKAWEAKSKEWQGKARQRFWIAVALGAVSLIGLVLFIRKKIVKP